MPENNTTPSATTRRDFLKTGAAAAALAALPALWIGSRRFRYTAAPADASSAPFS